MSGKNLPAVRACRPAWNKGRIVGQKSPLRPKHVWAIRVRLELAARTRDVALFNLAIDSMLRGCDLVCLRVADVFSAGRVKERASITQSKPVGQSGSRSPRARARRSRTGSKTWR